MTEDEKMLVELDTFSKTLQINTTRGFEFIDITDHVLEVVNKARITDGFIVVYSLHTTAAVIINENEPLLIKDMEETLRRIAPPNGDYGHNDFSARTVNICDDECKNGHSHCQHLFLGTSETIPLLEGKHRLGRWQRIFLVELDSARPRQVVVSILGR
ncbi:MAG: secondary thiamine-phosphate synthase enzyme YjbQ [Thermodesulfobacteriota bacterium]